MGIISLALTHCRLRGLRCCEQSCAQGTGSLGSALSLTSKFAHVS